MTVYNLTASVQGFAVIPPQTEACLSIDKDSRRRLPINVSKSILSGSTRSEPGTLRDDLKFVRFDASSAHVLRVVVLNVSNGYTLVNDKERIVEISFN